MKMEDKIGRGDSDIEKTIQCFKYVKNIMNVGSKGIPFYYLNIPFLNILVIPELISIFT
jgi:hypothetical protein